MGHRPSCVPVVLRYYDITSAWRPGRRAAPRSHPLVPRRTSPAIGIRHQAAGSRPLWWCGSARRTL
eukprot:1504099-Prymnesium_polylepis.1